MSENDLRKLLQPYVFTGTSVPAELYNQLTNYLELLLKWNARTNLTAIRNPEDIVRRHFGESLFAAQHLDTCKTLLDFGSGAGFPGLPIQLFRPDIHVTLAESQNKKAAFLQEAVRTLGVTTAIWTGRVEAMPDDLRFDVVTLRAVDSMDAAIAAAASRTDKQIMILTTMRLAPRKLTGFVIAPGIPLPGANEQQLVCINRQI